MLKNILKDLPNFLYYQQVYYFTLWSVCFTFLGIEWKTLWMLQKHSTIELYFILITLHSQAYIFYLQPKRKKSALLICKQLYFTFRFEVYFLYDVEFKVTSTLRGFLELDLFVPTCNVALGRRRTIQSLRPAQAP